MPTPRHSVVYRPDAVPDTNQQRKGKGKEEYLYSAFSQQGTYKVLRRGSHNFTGK